MSHHSLNPLIEKTAALTDADLVARAKQGEALAFEVIVRRNNQRLFRAARGMVADDATAQDMVQEAYLNAFTHLDDFRSDAALRTWLTRIVINQCASHLRRQRPVVALDDSGTLLSIAPTEEDDMSSHLTAKRTPEDDVDRQQITEILQHAISHLPEAYRSVFMLREVEGMSVAECAWSLNVSEDVIKTRLLRARAMLKQRLASKLQAHVHDTFEFAGRRCDQVTQHVLDELLARGLIRHH